MKASKLIKILQSLVKEFGDLEVRDILGGKVNDAYFVSHEDGHMETYFEIDR